MALDLSVGASKTAQVPKNLRLTFEVDSTLPTLLNMAGGGDKRLMAMRLATKQAELREKAADKYFGSLANHATPELASQEFLVSQESFVAPLEYGGSPITIAPLESFVAPLESFVARQTSPDRSRSDVNGSLAFLDDAGRLSFPDVPLVDHRSLHFQNEFQTDRKLPFPEVGCRTPSRLPFPDAGLPAERSRPRNSCRA